MAVNFGEGTFKPTDLKSTGNQAGLILIDRVKPAIGTDGSIGVDQTSRLGSLTVTEAEADQLSLLIVNHLLSQMANRKVELPSEGVAKLIKAEFAREIKHISSALQFEGDDHALDQALRTISALQSGLPRFHNQELASVTDRRVNEFLDRSVAYNKDPLEDLQELLLLRDAMQFNRHKFIAQGDFLQLSHYPRWLDTSEENLSIDKRRELFNNYIQEIDDAISELSEKCRKTKRQAQSVSPLASAPTLVGTAV